VTIIAAFEGKRSRAGLPRGFEPVGIDNCWSLTTSTRWSGANQPGPLFRNQLLPKCRRGNILRALTCPPYK